jgi:hypothetical protein
MTTQTLTHTISLRRQLSVDELIQFAPQIADYIRGPVAERAPARASANSAAEARGQSDAEHAFWSTFTFGCIQAVILFWLIYSYFAD